MKLYGEYLNIKNSEIAFLENVMFGYKRFSYLQLISYIYHVQ